MNRAAVGQLHAPRNSKLNSVEVLIVCFWGDANQYTIGSKLVIAKQLKNATAALSCRPPPYPANCRPILANRRHILPTECLSCQPPPYPGFEDLINVGAIGRLAISRIGFAVGRIGLAVGRLGLAVGRIGLAVGRLGLAFGR